MYPRQFGVGAGRGHPLQGSFGGFESLLLHQNAGVAKSEDALASEASDRKVMEVQVLSPAPKCVSDEIGRHAALRALSPRGGEGSSPFLRTRLPPPMERWCLS